MTASLLSDDAVLQRKRFRRMLRWALAFLFLFCANSVFDLVSQPGPITALSTVVDITLTLMIGIIYVLSARREIATLISALSVTVMLYSVINILLFPSALLRVVGLPLLALS